MKSFPTAVVLFLAAVAIAPPSFAAVARSVVPIGLSGGLQARLPQLAVELDAQIAALSAQSSPRLMAESLSLTLSAPGATPPQLVAAKLLVEALTRPAALPLVQGLFKDVQSGAKLGRDLGSLSERFRSDPAGARVFDGVLAQAAARDWSAADREELQANLDAVFTGAAHGLGDFTAVVEPAADGAPRGPESWRLRKAAPPAASADMQEPYRVKAAGATLESSVSLGDLMKAFETDDLAFLDRFLPKDPRRPQDRLILLEDGKNRVRVAMVKAEKTTEGKRTLWADFFESDRHPLLVKLTQKFTFAPFRDKARHDNQVAYEEPYIDADNIQLTTYGMQLSSENEVLTNETMHLYVGDRILVTTHAQKRPSVNKALRLLAETGRFKTPTQMMSFILGDTVNRYSSVVDSLSKDFSGISEKMARKETDDSILQDAVKAGRKIDRIYETVLKQKQVLQDLLGINEFHQSPFVPVPELEKQLRALDHHLTVLDHYQERKNGLIDLYRAKVGNDMDDAMKRLAALSILIAPSTIIGGFMGMNVGIPGGAGPQTFLWVLGIAASVTAGIFFFFKKKKWL